MAKRFEFKLNSLLKLRSYKAQLAEESLYNVMQMRIDKEELISARKEYYSQLLTKKNGSSKAGALQSNIHHREYVEKEILKLEKELQRLREIENIRRKHLSDALKDEKVLEKLKERKIATHKSDSLKEENAVLDEISINRMNGNKR